MYIIEGVCLVCVSICVFLIIIVVYRGVFFKFNNCTISVQVLF